MLLSVGLFAFIADNFPFFASTTGPTSRDIIWKGILMAGSFSFQHVFKCAEAQSRPVSSRNE